LSALPAISVSFIVKLTAMLMLGAQTIGMTFDAASSAASCSGSSPVVAITSGVFVSVQYSIAF